MCQEQVAHVVDAKLRLDAVTCHILPALHDASVVDQRVALLLLGPEGGNKLPDRLRAAQITLPRGYSSTSI